MKALVITRFGQSPRVEVQQRTPPQVGEGFTLVKMHAATVNQQSNQIPCGTVSSAIAPLVLSNDGAGTVLASDRLATMRILKLIRM